MHTTEHVYRHNLILDQNPAVLLDRFNMLPKDDSTKPILPNTEHMAEKY